jgi:hypothetical protein
VVGATNANWTRFGGTTNLCTSTLHL